MVLLDTNILSEPVRKIPDRKVYARLSVQAGNFAASVITLDELRYGAMLHPQSKVFWSKIETTVIPLVRWMKIDQDSIDSRGFESLFEAEGPDSGNLRLLDRRNRLD